MTQQPSIVGIDLAQRIFHLVGMDNTGHVVFRKRLTREALLPFRGQLPPGSSGWKRGAGHMIGHASSVCMSIR